MTMQLLLHATAHGATACNVQSSFPLGTLDTFASALYTDWSCIDNTMSTGIILCLARRVSELAWVVWGPANRPVSHNNSNNKWSKNFDEMMHRSRSKSLRCCCQFAKRGRMHTCKNMYVCVVFARVYRLIFTRLSVNVERLVGFIMVYSNWDSSLKGRCYGNRFFVACI